MTITEIHVTPRSYKDRSNLVAWVNLVIDGAFAVRRIRVIRAESGRWLLAFPSQPRKVACPECGVNGAVTARYCHHCGAAVPEEQPQGMDRYQDLAHPISTEARLAIERAVFPAVIQVLSPEPVAATA